MSGFLVSMEGAVSQGIVWGIMVLGVYITYKILDIADLTVDGSFALGSVVCALLIVKYEMNPLLAALIAGGAGMLAGAATGFLHTVCEIPAILAGILTQLGLYSINLRILGNASNMAISVDKYDLLVSLRYIKGVPFYKNTLVVAALIIILLIGVLYWFFGTELGCSIRATGANPRMSCAQGININFCKILGLMLSNGIVALASGLYAQYQGFADVQAGRGAIVIGLAAVIIGQVVFGKICKNFATRLLAVALGAVIYYLVLQVVLWLGLNANDLKLISAIVVAVFLAIPVLLEKWKIKRAYTEGGER